MPEPNEHYSVALDTFYWAEKIYKEEDYRTASLNYINAAIKFNDFLCHKYLHEIFSRKHHSDPAFIQKLQKFLGIEYDSYKSAYQFLMDYKTQTDYGTGISENIAKQIQRKARKIKEIAENHY